MLHQGGTRFVEFRFVGQRGFETVRNCVQPAMLLLNHAQIEPAFQNKNPPAERLVGFKRDCLLNLT
jgi:hypothetical protein